MGVALDVGSGCFSVLAGGENSCCLEKSLVGYNVIQDTLHTPSSHMIL